MKYIFVLYSTYVRFLVIILLKTNFFVCVSGAEALRYVSGFISDETNIIVLDIKLCAA
jgi:hypothetical protein